MSLLRCFSNDTALSMSPSSSTFSGSARALRFSAASSSVVSRMRGSVASADAPRRRFSVGKAGFRSSSCIVGCVAEALTFASLVPCGGHFDQLSEFPP